MEFVCTDSSDGTITSGGYSDHMVADEHFVLHWADNLPPDFGAPLLCVLITTCNRTKNTTPSMEGSIDIVSSGRGLQQMLEIRKKNKHSVNDAHDSPLVIIIRQNCKNGLCFSIARAAELSPEFHRPTESVRLGFRKFFGCRLYFCPYHPLPAKFFLLQLLCVS
ncbi:unnamed protein product [Lactuca virosa]|uniref:Uncharacterized protein n=1 Tax=Lactuca virosa TaxID=75947 RepID=A0AAU9P199_9ASTR|nr:unnamed protein product [Lactuca virosa]